jgi:hypothetical protein
MSQSLCRFGQSERRGTPRVIHASRRFREPRAEATFGSTILFLVRSSRESGSDQKRLARHGLPEFGSEVWLPSRRRAGQHTALLAALIQIAHQFWAGG